MLDGANKEFAFHMVWTNSEVTDPAGLSGNQAGFTLPTDDNTMLSVVHQVVDRHSGCRSTWSLCQASPVLQKEKDLGPVGATRSFARLPRNQRR